MNKMMLQYPIFTYMDIAAIELIARKVSKEGPSAFWKQNFDAAQSLYNHGLRFPVTFRQYPTISQTVIKQRTVDNNNE